jgi:holo-[acyl-carrier protein] synthase
MIEVPFGLGVDLVYIPKLQKLCEVYGNRFLTKVFTEEELVYAQKKPIPYPHLASSFAVKEAFYKALGGYRPFRFKEISLVRTEKGPSVKLSGRAKEVFDEVGGQKILLSLSHDFNYTIAVVLIIKAKD